MHLITKCVLFYLLCVCDCLTQESETIQYLNRYVVKVAQVKMCCGNENLEQLELQQNVEKLGLQQIDKLVQEADKIQYLNRYVVKVAKGGMCCVKANLKQLGLLQIDKIVPFLYEFRRVSQSETSDWPDYEFLERLKTCCDGKVLAAEQVKKHTIALSTSPGRDEGNRGVKYQKKATAATTYDDIGIRKAWDRGYSGKGVTAAVTGVGINPELRDLKPNLNETLCFNAIKGSKPADARPKTYPSYHESEVFTNHENMCAGIVAAFKNDHCGDGVAHRSKLVGIKIFNVKKYTWDRVDVINSDIARGLAHANNVIAVYSNSWSSPIHFATNIGIASMEALKTGTTEGRGGKGSVYVFPVGAINDGYANSMYTVTVNGVGIQRTVQPYTGRGACVLTTTYGEASRSDTDLLTTCDGSPSQCTDDFRGTSAATAIVAGIVALTIEANPSLTWRDIQHMIVKASEIDNLTERDDFTTNRAGYLFHPQFGFGMLNASKMVEMADSWSRIPEQTCVGVIMTTQGCHQDRQQWMCKSDMEIANIGEVEHVTVIVSYTTPNEYNTNIVVVSPSNTTSVLMDFGQSDNTMKTDRKRVTFLSVNFWGEHVTGTWRLILTNQKIDDSEPAPSLTSASISICGTGSFTADNDNLQKKSPRDEL